MAATNFTPIQLYFSTTASAVPVAANLAQGELAINITDGKLYYEDNSGVVQVIATKGAGTIGGSTTQIQYNNAGALAGNAAMVFNNSTNVTTLTTLNLTNALGAIYGGTAQSTYTQGDFLYASASNTLAKLGIGANTYILTSTGSVPQWVAPSSIAVLTATNLAGGLAGSVPYQSALDTTTFLAIGAANRVMTSTGTAPQWVTSLTGLTGVSSSSITNTSLTSGRVVVSSTAGLQADDADLTFDGTTLSAGGFSTVGLSTLVKTVKIGDSSFNGVAVFAAATPAKLYMGTGTVTDVTSAISATNAVGAIASLGITPIAATNTSVTYTNAATLYIAGAPSAGTNVTLTNPYALYVAAGDAYFGGTVTAGTVNLTTLDLTNLEVTNIKAKDGTAAMTIADSTGVVSFTANPVLSGGTANGVLYLNGSKVAASGSALTFDGNIFSVLSAGNNPVRFSSSSTSNTLIELTNSNASKDLISRFRQNGGSGNFWDLTMEGSTNGFTFDYNDGELLRITSAGSVAIGTSTAITKLTVNGTDGITMQRSTANAFAPVLDYLKSRGTSASPAGVSDGDGLFLLRVAPYQGSAFTYLNAMTVEVDGGYTAGQNPPTRQIFYTNAANGSSTNRFNITSAGNVGIGVTAPLARLSVQYADSTPSSSGNMTSGAVFTYDPGGVALNVGSSSGGYTYFNSAYANNAGVAAEWRLYQGATQAITLNTSAQLMLGTTTAQASFTIGTGGTTNTNAIIVGPTSGTAVVGDKIVIGFQLRNDVGGGTGNQYAAAIAGIQDKSSSNGGGLGFYTQASAGDGTPERARFTSNGTFKIGTTNSTVGTNNLLIVGSGNQQNGAVTVINTANANVNGLMVSNWDGTTTTQGPRIQFDNSGRGTFIFGCSDSANNFDICQTWGTPAVRIDTNNNLLVGETSVPTTTGATTSVIYQKGGIWSYRGTFSAAGSTTTAFLTLPNASNNQSYIVSARQSGAGSNYVVAFAFAYGSSLSATRSVQDNTNPVLDMNITASGLNLQLVLAAGFGATTWDWTVTRIS